MAEHFDLDRFVQAQAAAYETALGELEAGRKRSHWMWFVFPQLAGLGLSPTARHYAIGSLAEARAYLAHPILGGRLRESLKALQLLDPTTPEAVFGPIDAVKFRSSLTLFAAAEPADAIVGGALDHWFGGAPDDRTMRLLEENPDQAG